MSKQRNEIARALAVAAEVCGSQLSEGAIAIMADELDSSYEFEAVAKALKIVVTRAHRTPDAWPPSSSTWLMIQYAPVGADQAWAIAVGARVWDEQATLIIPEAILPKHSPFCSGPMTGVGARMAFKDSYPANRSPVRRQTIREPRIERRGSPPIIEEAVRKGF